MRIAIFALVSILAGCGVASAGNGDDTVCPPAPVVVTIAFDVHGDECSTAYPCCPTGTVLVGADSNGAIVCMGQ